MQSGFSKGRLTKAFVSCFVCFTLLQGSAVCLSTTRHVPSEYPTIKAAVLAAQDGDTVIIANGTYVGEGNREIPVTGKRISIQSSGDPAVCIIDLESLGCAFIVENSEGFTLTGITIRNGTITSGYGGGILSSTQSAVRINHCRFETSNASPGSGGALYLINGSLDIDDSVFQNNRSICTNPIDGGGAIKLVSCHTRMIGCVFSENQAREYPNGLGGAICSSGNAVITIFGCTFERNDADLRGSAIYSESPIFIQDSMFRGNTSRHTASAIELRNCEAQFANCVLQSNHEYAILHDSEESLTLFNILACDNGSGLTQSRGSVNASFCTFTGYETGMLDLSETNATIDSCILWSLESPAIDPGSGQHQITNSIIRGGFAGDGNLDLDPIFTMGPRGNYYLSHIGSGQFETSPGIDHSSKNAKDVFVRTESDLLELDKMTTCSDDTVDTLAADIGYHYRPIDYAPPVGPAKPRIRLTQSHSTPVAGQEYRLDAQVFMLGEAAQYVDQPFVLLMEVGGLFYWYPLFTNTFQYQAMDLGPGDVTIPILQFTWPQIADPIPPITFYCAFLTTDLSLIFGDWDSIRLN